MAKLWIFLACCVALTYASQLEYDSNELTDFNYDDYMYSNEKLGESDNVENVDNIDNSEKGDNLGEDEKGDGLRDSAEFASNEEKDYYNDFLEKDDHNGDLPYNDASEEKSFDVDKNIEALPLPPIADLAEQKNTLNDTKPLLSKEEENDFVYEDNDDPKKEEKSESTKTIEGETKDRLEPEPDFSDILDEDTVNKVYEDLNEDLVKLMETLKKLTTPSEKNADDSLSPNDISEYEEKYGRPYKEGVVLSLRNNDYEDENPTDEINNKDEDTNSKTTQATLLDTENIKKQENTQNYEQISNVNDDIQKETESDVSLLEKNTTDNHNVEIPKSTVNDDDVITDGKDTDYGSEIIKTEKNHDESSIAEKQELKMYLNDAIEPDKKLSTTKTDDVDVKTIDVSDLNPEQYHQLMEQFKILHKEELSVDSSGIAVIHIPLSLDEPVVVTSPNYPANYPTNNIVDWMFEGDGVGIELNVTDFAVNGVRGDYLLVKPGGVDESGTDGLLFSYRLNEPRRYRFLDVDRMFVRFVANEGFQMFRGFQFSVKMVAPPISMEEEPLPEPEPELPEPVETFTIVLGGVPAAEFVSIREDIRVLLADMATLYINSNGVDPGLNTTLEVTQITNVAVCNINWPNFMKCSQVTFAVPLVYEDQDDDDEPKLSTEDLKTMWNMYYNQDPFAARLRRLGVTEFASPNDSSVQAVWLVISAGVVLITGILAIVLWRYSCVDTYTRMPEPSFRDSGFDEKRGLDLYPTPHQTLPPLYDGDYKWSDGNYDTTARVDMGGYTNRNFTRDELSDIETDEEVVSTRDRYTTDV